jgi:glycosyltransferase involved in cell wall biosynthesis
MFECLVKAGHQVIPVNAELTGLRRSTAAVTSISSNKQAWRSRFRYGNVGSRLRTSAATASLGKSDVDVILQVGATFDPPRAGSIPYAIYSDWNMALDAEESKVIGKNSRGLALEEIERIGREHARRYERAAVIFTISERLRRSFIELYGISADRVHTAYAGPNFDMGKIEAALQLPKHSKVPTVLFVAKEFARKGGGTVAAAFAILRKRLPEARLVFAGSESLPGELRSLGNVEHLGLLDKANPDQLRVLLAAYRDADVLVLPSRHDPFPTVIREAMFFGVPCIASDIWAMPEMIEDGKTGFLVPVDDAEALSSKLELLLADTSLRAQMGQAARARAEAMFSWEAVAKALSDGLQQCRQ